MQETHSAPTSYRFRWRRIRLAVIVLAATAVSVPAAADTIPPGTREVHGSVAAAAGPNGTARCAPPPAPATPPTATRVDEVTPGRVFALTADAGSWTADLDITFFASEAACAAGTALSYKNHAGDENSVVPGGAGLALVTLYTGEPGTRFTYRELPDAPLVVPEKSRRRPTVVAVIEHATAVGGGDNGFTPYHLDFAASEHPWATDSDPDTGVDFQSDPSSWLQDFPETTPVELTLPQSSSASSRDLYLKDKAKWDAMMGSSLDSPVLYRFPGTKVVAAAYFSGGNDRGNIYGTRPTADKTHNETHATKAASVAVGNRNGTCSECAVVMLRAGGGQFDEALMWAMRQRWIDVVTTSLSSGTLVAGDGIYLSNPQGFVDEMKAAVERGQTIIWSAGNGVDGELVVPSTTYTSSQKGPDWVVTVGGVSAWNDQSRGSHRSPDVGAYSHNYPSAGAEQVSGTSQFDGTSAAAPIVAGTFANVLQRARDLVGDKHPGHHKGIVASGQSIRCGPATKDCPLDDGTLTRRELQAVVFGNVLPSVPRPMATQPGDVRQWQYLAATTPSVFPHTGQGHGIVYGRWDKGRFVAEQRRMLDALRGAVVPYRRPPGEATWMTVDSKCRQRLWGAWDEGYYTAGEHIAFEPARDAPSLALDTWCSQMEQDTFKTGELLPPPAGDLDD